MQPSRLEISIKSEADLQKLTDWLKPLMGDEAAEQCIFVLRTMIEEDYVNRCNDATREFGERLATRYGGEESLVDLVPDVEISDARSYSSLSKIGYRGDHHSVALMELKGEKPASVIVDLTYGSVASDAEQDTALVLYAPGGTAEAMEKLKETYGGSWQVELKLNSRTGKFVFQDGSQQGAA